MANETYLWRMHIKTASTSATESPFDFCHAKGVLGFGYPLYDDDQQRIVPKDIDECRRLGREQYEHSSKGFTTAINAFKEMAIDDLVWARQAGEYYLCRVMGGWKYEATDEHIDADVVNVIPCEFVNVGTVEKVPGRVVNCFRSPSTVQRIRGSKLDADGTEINPALSVSMSLYNRLTGTNHYPTVSVQRADIIEMLLPEDMEEVISLFLQAECGYYLYSSSNKLSTQAYEFVMVHPSDGHTACAQVKTGDVPLDGNDYVQFAANNDKVYLFTACGRYINVHYPNIDVISKEAVIDFMFAQKTLLPERISAWFDQIAVVTTP